MHQIVENTKYFNIFKIKEPTKIYIDENGNKVEIKKEDVEEKTKESAVVVPRWLKRTHKLNEKRKAGKIEIDKDKIKIFDNGNDGGTF